MRTPSLLIVAVALVATAASTATAAVDLAAVDNPRALRIRDPGAENDWNRLFADRSLRVQRAVTAIVLNAPDQYLTMLSARLLYVGPPWQRRSGDDGIVDATAWTARNREIQGAILRELRWHDDGSLAEIYRRYLSTVVDAELAVSALIDCAQVDPAMARAAAIALTTPGPSAPLGAAKPAVRARALAWLVETVGLEDAQARAALERALLDGTAAERIAALRLVPMGELPDLLERAALALVTEHYRGRLLSEEQSALVQMVALLHGVADPILVQALARLVTDGERPLAAAAATALAAGIGRDCAVDTTPWIDRALASDDAAMRHCLIGLILRHHPRGVRAVSEADSPWRRLAEHRERLAGWAWQGVVE
ncbi:MAG TPA: hypothetical protein VEL07_18850 [Planctomycetota bacterium]|nr:hypothetical protein [Planctomycetota bacterium]